MKRQPGIHIIALLSLLQPPAFAAEGDKTTAPTNTAAQPAAQAGMLMKAASETDDKDMKMMMMMMAMQQMQQASANKKADSQNDKSNKARKDDEKDAKGEQKIAMPSPMPSPNFNTEKPTEDLTMVDNALKKDTADRAAREKDLPVVDTAALIAPNVVSGEFDINKFVKPKEAVVAETKVELPPGKTTLSPIEKPAEGTTPANALALPGQPHPGGNPPVMAQIAKPLSVNDLGQISKQIEATAAESIRASKSTKDEPAEGGGGDGGSESSSGGNSAIEDFFAALNGEMEGSGSMPTEEGAVEGSKEKSDVPNIFQVAQGMYHYAAYSQKRVNLKPVPAPSKAEVGTASKITEIASNN